jgi:membrane fusion protein (multidrug efflux system)
VAGTAVGAVLLGGGFVVVFHADWLKPAPGIEEEAQVETEVPVHVATIHRATLHRYVDGYGLVSSEPAHDGKPAAGAQLASPVAGVLAASSCAEGDHVEKGATLFQLDARAMTAEEQKAAAAEGSASATLLRLRGVVEYAQRDLDRARGLHRESLASAKELQDAELKLLSAKNELLEAQAKTAEAHQGLVAVRTQRSLLAIKAPLSGTVVRVNVSPGEAVDINPSTVLAEIVDLDRLVVAASVPAARLPSLKLGQPVELYLVEKAREGDVKVSGNASPGEDAVQRGSLAFIGFQVDTKTDTVPIRIAIPREAGLRPGQYLRVRVAVEEHADCLVVPSESVVTGPEGGTVVAVVEGDKASQKPVKIGLREGGLVEVQGEGLREGLTVVTAGAYGLPHETKVRVIHP